MAKKEKKEKVVYIDDGRTIADMSNIQGRRLNRDAWKTNSTAKEKWQTYWGAVKMMFVPMLVTIAALIIVYLLVYAYFSFT